MSFLILHIRENFFYSAPDFSLVHREPSLTTALYLITNNKLIFADDIFTLVSQRLQVLYSRGQSWLFPRKNFRKKFTPYFLSFFFFCFLFFFLAKISLKFLLFFFLFLFFFFIKDIFLLSFVFPTFLQKTHIRCSCITYSEK